jgi:hypothetical protein
MKVICINNKECGVYSLTIGKLYNVINTYSEYSNKNKLVYIILNDDEYFWKYSCDLFKTIDEVRQEKLEDLGI